MDFAFGQPCWMDVTVKDVQTRDGLMVFLGGLFGWTFDVGGEEVGGYTTAYSDGASVAAVMADPDGYGQFLSYFAVTGIDAVATKAADLGANVFMGPMKVNEFGSMAIGTDPTGAAFGLWEKDSFAGFEAFGRPNAPCWFDHQSADQSAAARFYTTLLGLTLDPMGGEGGGVLMKDEDMVASISGEAPGAPPHWSSIIMVSSLTDTEAKAVELGAAVLVSGMDVPGGIASAFAAPVTGTVVTVFEPTGMPPG